MRVTCQSVPGRFVLDSAARAGDKALLIQGGRGGRGNAAFKSAKNKAPVIAEDGEAGAGAWLDLELKLIADVGIIGMPSAGAAAPHACLVSYAACSRLVCVRLLRCLLVRQRVRSCALFCVAYTAWLAGARQWVAVLLRCGAACNRVQLRVVVQLQVVLHACMYAATHIRHACEGCGWAIQH